MSGDNSFGIKRILECKIENGQQMYKIEWETTWEPAETLAFCQHMIDDFWSLVNKAKSKEHLAQKHLNLKPKAFLLQSPSNLLHRNLQQDHEVQGSSKMHMPDIAQKYLNFNNGPTSANKGAGPGKVEKFPIKSDDFAETISDQKAIADSKVAADPKATGMASLRYLENFSNPYVKIIIVCKICNKEQSLRFAGNWRQHYMTHSEKKPHTCPHCSKSFIRADRLRQHIQKSHGIDNDQHKNNLMVQTQPMALVKEEQMMLPNARFT